MMLVIQVVDTGASQIKKRSVKITLAKESYLLSSYHSVSGLERTSWAKEMLLCYIMPLCDLASIPESSKSSNIAGGRPFPLFQLKFTTDHFTLLCFYISIVLYLKQFPSSDTHASVYGFAVLQIPLVLFTKQTDIFSVLELWTIIVVLFASPQFCINLLR